MNTLEKIIIEIIGRKPPNKAKFDNVRQQVCGQMKIQQPGNRELLQVYQKLVKNKKIKRDLLAHSAVLLS